MSLLRLSALLAAAALANATASTAAVHQVSPGKSIQEALDNAAPGDTILVDPGVYEEEWNTDFGLRISTDNLRLIGKVDEAGGKVRLVKTGDQFTGVYAAPAACGPDVGVGECPDQLQGFYIRGFSVEDFPRHGIQTRFVDGLTIQGNASVRNLENGIYPTISANGLVQENVSYGSLDTAMWVAASENVRVIENEMYDSVIGLEITVSDDVEVKGNSIHHNVVGVGLFHPNAAGNDPLPEMNNWVIEQNHIYNNNLYPSPAPSHGVLTIGGVISMTIGSLMLFESPAPFMKVSLALTLPAVIVTAAFFVLTIRLAFKAYQRKPVTGQEGLIGEKGIADTEITQDGGMVYLHGERWSAYSDEKIEKGDKVIVDQIVGLKIKARKL